MFRIRGILRRIQILGSVHWITDPDPALDPTPAPDPDPALFVSGLQDANKKKGFFLLRFFAYNLLSVLHLHQSSKITNH